MKNIILIFFLLSISCNNKVETKKHNSNLKSSEVPNIEVKTKNTESNSNLTKNIIKYGITYNLNEQWKLINDDNKTIDLKGNTKTIETSYTNVNNNSKLYIINHNNKNGNKIYKSRKKEVNGETVKILNVSNREAVITTKLLDKNGKGKIIKPSIKKIIVSFINDEGFLVEIKISINSENKEQITNDFLDFISTIKLNN